MPDQRRIDMKMSGTPEESAWIKMINGERPTAGGKIIKTKKDLLEVKKYLGMVTQKVRDAYNKRLAELSRKKTADSVDAIAEKYGHKVQQNDAPSNFIVSVTVNPIKVNVKASSSEEAKQKAVAELKKKWPSIYPTKASVWGER